MNKTVALLLLATPLLFASGCKSGPDIAPADKLAQTDPNAKAAELLKTCMGLSVDERAAWVQQNSFAFTVFDKVTDPKLKDQYDKEIKPLIATKS
jgi:hypothetical protein